MRKTHKNRTDLLLRKDLGSLNYKQMKKNKILLIILFAAGVSSCNYLDVIPDDVPTIEMAFTTRENAGKFLETCYSYIPSHGNIFGSPALETNDEVWLCAEKTYYFSNGTSFAIAKGFQNTGTPHLDFWSGGTDANNLYIALRDCNVFLENVDNVPNMTMSEKTQWKAEVLVLKAYYHYFLMQLYGPIPIIRENIPISASPEEVKVVREPVDDVVNYIVSLINTATEDKTGLVLPYIVQETEIGRITLAAALGIKAKILTLAASPLFNGNSDFVDFKDTNDRNFINPVEDAKKWKAAAEACKEAIEYAHLSGHGLYEFNDVLLKEVSDTTRLELTLRNTLTAAAKDNKELIWGRAADSDTEFLQKVANAPLTPYHQGRQIDWCISMHNPTLNVAEEFYTKHGVPMSEDNTYDYPGRYTVDDVPIGHNYYIAKDFRTAKMNFNREPRYYAYLGFDGGKWFNLEAPSDKESFMVRGKALELSGMNLANYNITGFYAKKLVNYKLVMTEASHTGGNCGYVFPIIRLADLYLLYAEALNECTDAPNAEIYEYIQKVRDKAGLDKETGNLVQTWNTYSNNPAKPTTKKGMQSIIRQERLIELAFEGQRFYDLRRWGLAMEYLNRPIKGWNVSGTTEMEYYQVRYIFQRKFTKKDYFWPIKTYDLYVNNKLQQNPGWE